MRRFPFKKVAEKSTKATKHLPNHSLYKGIPNPPSKSQFFAGIGWQGWGKWKPIDAKTVDEHVYNELYAQPSHYTSLTSSPDVAKRFAHHGGYDANDPEATSSRKESGSIAVINSDYLYEKAAVSDFLSEDSDRVKHEKEIITTMVCPFAISHWIIDGITFDNPLYIPLTDSNRDAVILLTNLHADLLNIMTSLRGDDSLSDAKSQKALEAYIKQYATLCGGPAIFSENIKYLLSESHILESNPSFKRLFEQMEDYLKSSPKSSPR